MRVAPSDGSVGKEEENPVESVYSRTIVNFCLVRDIKKILSIVICQFTPEYSGSTSIVNRLLFYKI